jgi:hypothetical protein
MATFLLILVAVLLVDAAITTRLAGLDRDAVEADPRYQELLAKLGE